MMKTVTLITNLWGGNMMMRVTAMVMISQKTCRVLLKKDLRATVPVAGHQERSLRPTLPRRRRFVF